MMTHRSVHRLVALAAALGLALQPLWPSLANARPNAPSLAVPLCAVDGGTKFLEIGSSDPPLDHRAALHCGHCALCAFSSERMTALPHAADPIALADIAIAPVVSTRIPDRKPASRSTAQPRAPPV